MSIDADNKLIKTESDRIYISRFIKNNTAQIALIAPFILALISGVGNFLIYIYKKGYYDYFSLDNKFIVFEKTSIIYEIITACIVCLMFWSYSIFSMRMHYKRDILMIVICFVIIPFTCNFLLLRYSVGTLPLNNLIYFIAVILCIIILTCLNCALIYVFGRGMAGAINNDVLEKYRQYQKDKKDNKRETNKFKLKIKEHIIKFFHHKKNKRFKQTDRDISAIIIFTITIILYIFFISHLGYIKAKNQKQFDTVQIKNSIYAVIATDGKQFVLELCDISNDKKNLIIDTNTYMKVDCKNLIIQQHKFEKVTTK